MHVHSAQQRSMINTFVSYEFNYICIYTVSAVFVGKSLDFRGRAADANCHGHVHQIEIADFLKLIAVRAFACFGIGIYASSCDGVVFVLVG
eukprot:6201777-Pleurochrysis_carterae.AAC.1